MSQSPGSILLWGFDLLSAFFDLHKLDFAIVVLKVVYRIGEFLKNPDGGFT